MTAELVTRARSGDHAAFSALAAASVARLHRIARLILRDEELASDAVQEALVSAWLDIASVRDPDKFEAWLHRLLVRACYREAARHRRRRVVEIQMAPIDSHGPDDTPHDLATRDLLERGFRQLTSEHRAVLVVHHYLGLRDEEAARVLGVAAGTFKSRLHRASAALRAAIEADERLPESARESMA
jgi:RNA polymerase sigma-70 factor (ECF subfamily)